MHARSTIAAISSPPGPARRGVIRLSGPRTAGLLRATCKRAGSALDPGGRCALEARFDDGVGEQPALVLWMPGPHSFTREDVAELHLPGSPYLLDRALRRLLELGAEPAAPGEFTRRAFLNGRIDLTRAEGVLALVSARGEEERRAATALLLGGLGTRMDELREALDALRALCEASLDFDEADTGHVPSAELLEALEGVAQGIDEALAYEERRTPQAGEPCVVLVGAPNAGKSSLFNRLVSSGRALDRALVSPSAGTTRDAKSARWRIGGWACRVVDTAGLDPVAAGLAREAQRHTAREGEVADLLLWVVDATRAVAQAELEFEGDAILVWNKIDLPAAIQPRVAPTSRARVRASVEVSARTGAGLDELARAVERALGSGDGGGPRAESGGGHAGLGRELYARHRDALTKAAAEVERARRALRAALPLDLVAEALRAATDELDKISGRTTPEDLLDRIFARFCLGK